MTHARFSYFYSYDERYTNTIQEENFEESEDDEPEAFDGIQKGNDLDESQEDDRSRVKPWDQTEIFFSYI